MGIRTGRRGALAPPLRTGRGAAAAAIAGTGADPAAGGAATAPSAATSHLRLRLPRQLPANTCQLVHHTCPWLEVLGRTLLNSLVSLQLREEGKGWGGGLPGSTFLSGDDCRKVHMYCVTAVLAEEGSFLGQP